jgi:predicted LPLAT superfamily acyltransferase
VHSAFRTRSEGFTQVRELYSRGRGVLLVGAHAGSADMAATGFGEHGLPTRIHTLQHEAQRDTIDHLAGRKAAEKVGVIYVSGQEPAIYEIHALLARGEVLGLMADRPLDHNFELVPFLGALAPVATSPFRIALATGAGVAFIAGFKENTLAYEFAAICPAPPFQEMGRELAAYHYASAYAAWLEGWLVKYPEQWFNLFPFFSSPPTLPSGERCEPKRSFFAESLTKQTPGT